MDVRIKAFVILMMFFNAYSYAQTKDVALEITGFRNNDGWCVIYIHNKKEGFPKKPEKQLAFPISENKSKVLVHLERPGTYAITILHDENSNDKMDSNFFGLPKEGLGTSNNAYSKLGPPEFDDACFVYDGTPMKLYIKVKYL